MRMSAPSWRRLSLGLLASGSLLQVSACTEPGTSAAEPYVDFNGASPESDPIPAGDPDDPSRPQIVSIDGPELAQLGQVITVRMTTDYEPPTGLNRHRESRQPQG